VKLRMKGLSKRSVLTVRVYCDASWIGMVSGTVSCVLDSRSNNKQLSRCSTQQKWFTSHCRCAIQSSLLVIRSPGSLVQFVNQCWKIIDR
jgi:hypothetical protein